MLYFVYFHLFRMHKFTFHYYNITLNSYRYLLYYIYRGKILSTIYLIYGVEFALMPEFTQFALPT